MLYYHKNNWLGKIPTNLSYYWRRERDSNPRYAERTTVFETAPIDHSGISPGRKNVVAADFSAIASAKLHKNAHTAKFLSKFFQCAESTGKCKIN